METLQHTAHQVSALNDLIRINNDRITGYKKIINAKLDDDLEDLFTQFIYQGQQNINDLTQYIKRLGGEPADGSRLSGKYYHAWMDMRATFNRLNRQAILDYSEYGEDVAKSSYRKALEDKELTWHDKYVQKILFQEFEELKRSHRIVEKLRDATTIS